MTTTKSKKTSNGFLLRLIHEEAEEKVYEIIYLKDGDVITEIPKTEVTVSNESQLKRLQDELLEEMLKNRNLEMENDPYVDYSSARKNFVGAVNGFCLEKEKTNDPNKVNLKIIYLKNGIFLTSQSFCEIDNETIQMIAERLLEYTGYNLTQIQQCRTMALLDILYMINSLVTK